MANQALSVKAVFDAARAIQSPAERKAYLDRVCAQAPPFRNAVEALLAAHEPAGGPPARALETAGAAAPVLARSPAADKPAPAPASRMIGPYKLLQEIGEGGMGTVWLAEQREPVQQRVALKVIKMGLGSPHAVARFEAERQALAMMDHPNIAKVLGAGTTPTGQPFFAMELVRGTPITKYCDEHRLTPRQRLELFVPVCHALQHAHQKGIIHRDVKPSNVLVAPFDGKPVVKVIDFGVAKATGQRLTEKTMFTELGAVVGTLEYMSPEQAELNNQDVDTRSDVYSLGVLLYELLTGSTPLTRQRLTKTSFADVLRLIREVDPPRPSTRLHQSKETLPAISAQRQMEPAKLTKSVRGELDWIVMKALDKDRSRRYETANGLARDVERYLQGDPVQACPPSAWYLLSKFARKHTKALATAAAFLLLLICAAVLSTRQAVRATRAEEKAQLDRNEAQTARDAAQTARDATQEALDTVRVARDGEKKQRAVAEEREKAAQRHLYAATLGLSPKALIAGRLADLADLLDATRPGRTGGADLRGWEWFRLHRLQRSELTRFQEHQGQVFAVALSPDGKRVASADDRGVIFVWDGDTGKARQRLTEFTGAVLGLAFSPNGRFLAAGSEDSSAAIFDLETGRVRHRLDGHVLAVNSVAYSHDGKVLATAGKDNTIKTWNAETGLETRTLVGHLDEVRRAWFQKDGQRLASIGEDRVLRFWDLADGKEDEKARGPGTSPNIALTPDLSRLAVWAPDRRVVVVRDVATRKEVGELPDYPRPVLDMSFSADGKRLATADEYGDVEVRDVKARRRLARYPAQPTRVALSDAGDRVVAACGDGIVRAWPARAPGLDGFLGHDGGVQKVAFHPTERLLATGDATGSIRTWNTQTGEPVQTFGLHLVEKGPEGAPPSERLQQAKAKATAEKRPPVRAHFRPPEGGYGPDSLRVVWAFEGHQGEIASLVFSPDGKMLASAANDAEARLWDVQTGKELKVLRHPQRLSSAAFSPDGKSLVTGCWDNAVRIWDVASGTEKLTLGKHEGIVEAVLFHPDGRHVASAGRDNVVCIWDVSTGKRVRKLEGHADMVHALALSPDGKLLASGGSDQTIRLWDFNTSRLRFVLRGHTERVTALVFHPTEDRLFSASNHASDTTVRAWDVEIGREVLALPAPAGSAEGLAFEPAGKRLAVTAERRIVLWGAAEREQTAPENPRNRAGRPAAVPKPPASGLKALGWQRLGRLIKDPGEKTSLEPTKPGHEFLVVVLSVPHELLYPTDAQYESLQKNARHDPTKPLAGPRTSYAWHDPERFALVLGDGKVAKGHAARLLRRTPLGFHTGIWGESSTATLAPQARSLVAIAWELPEADFAGAFRVRLESIGPGKPPPAVPVPALNLKDYQGLHGNNPHTSSRRNAGLPKETRTYLR